MCRVLSKNDTFHLITISDLTATFGFDFHIIIVARAAVLLFILIFFYPEVVCSLSLFQDTCPIKQRKHVREDYYISECSVSPVNRYYSSRKCYSIIRYCYKLTDILYLETYICIHTVLLSYIQAHIFHSWCTSLMRMKNICLKYLALKRITFFFEI